MKQQGKVKSFLQVVDQPLKILYILFECESSKKVLRHAQIIKRNSDLPGIERTSPRTIYKCYSRLLDLELIEKSRENTIKRQYSGYKITPLGENLISFLFSNVENQTLLTLEPSWELFRSQNQSIIDSEKSRNLNQPDFDGSEVEEEGNSGINAKQTQIESLNKKMEAIQQQILTLQDSQLRNFNSQIEKSNNININIPSPDKVISKDTPKKPSSVKQQIKEDVILDNVPQFDNGIEVDDGGRKEVSISNRGLPKTSQLPPQRIIKKPETFQEQVKKMPQDKIIGNLLIWHANKVKWADFLIALSARKDFFKLKGPIALELFKNYIKKEFGADESRSKNELHAISTELKFDMKDWNNLLVITGDLRVIELFIDFLIENFEPSQWNEKIIAQEQNGKGKSSILEFLFYVIGIYFSRNYSQRCWDLIQKIRSNYGQVSDSIFGYEISILIRQSKHDQAINHIITEIKNHRRPIKIKKIWYYIYRVFYEANQLQGFIELDYNRDNREWYFQWVKIAEISIAIKKGPENIPNFLKIRNSLEPILPIFKDIDVISIREKYLEILSNYLRTDSSDQVEKVYYYYHLAGLIYLLLSNPESLGLPRDYNANVLLEVCARPQVQGIYKDFPSVINEINEWRLK